MRLDVQLYIATTVTGVMAIFCLYTAVPLVSILRAFLIVMFTNISWSYIVPGLITLMLAAIFYITAKNKPARHFGVVLSVAYTVFLQYYKWYTWFALRRLIKSTENLENVQRQVLKKILDHASCTAYYTENDLDQIKHRDEFRSHHSLTTYEDYRKWIDRIIDGEDKVLTAEKVDFLVATTGTTSGKSKLFPKSQKYFFNLLNKEYLSYTVPMLNMPGAINAKPIFDVGFNKKMRTTKTGIKIGAISAIFNNFFGSFSTTPIASKDIPDMNTSIYVQLLFTLKVKEVNMMLMGFGSHAYIFFKMVEDRWPELCADIRRGEINDAVSASIPPYLREQLSSLLTPDHRRADELEAEFKKGIRDFVPRVWPRVSIICTVGTGAFAIYKSLLQEKYVGRIPVYTSGHGSSESMYGVNIWPGTQNEEFLILPNTAFFEYIEQSERTSGEFDTVLAHQLAIGKQYEIVVTSYEGLYRYRSNDVIEVTRFYNQAPVYKFIQRADDNLSVYGEKTPVSAVTAALEASVGQWGQCDVIDFTVTESIHAHDYVGESEHMTYVVILETSGEQPPKHVILQLDNELRETVEAYDIYREKGRIGPVRVVYSAPGAFHKLAKLILAHNNDATFSQFKVPRVVRKKEYIACLLSAPEQ